MGKAFNCYHKKRKIVYINVEPPAINYSVCFFQPFINDNLKPCNFVTNSTIEISLVCYKHRH